MKILSSDGSMIDTIRHFRLIRSISAIISAAASAARSP
jgi:hypothetical protein